MKSFVSSLLLLAFLSSSISSVHGKESVAELRRLRASRGLGGWNGGDNGRDHPGKGQTTPTEEDANAAVAASTTTGEATVRLAKLQLVDNDSLERTDHRLITQLPYILTYLLFYFFFPVVKRRKSLKLKRP